MKTTCSIAENDYSMIEDAPKAHLQSFSFLKKRCKGREFFDKVKGM